MPRIHPTPLRAPRAILAAALCAFALAACGGGDRPASAAAADSGAAPADTSALAVARRHLGDQVRSAVPFRLQNRAGRFIAAALPVLEWVDDPLRQGVSVAPGGHEVVLLELADTAQTFAVNKPGLYVTDLPGTPRSGPNAPVMPDSSALRHLSGVEDLNGDGDVEVWTVQYGGPRHPYTWEMRAYDRGGHALYQLAVRVQDGGPDLAPETWDASRNLRDDDAMYASMRARIQALQARFARVDSAAAGGAR